VLESSPPRLTDRRGEPLWGHSDRAREPSALSKAGWSMIGRPRDPWSATHPDALLEAEGWNSKSSYAGRSHLRQRTLIGYLPQGEQAADRAGMFGHPTAKGYWSRGDGALRSILRRALLRAKPRPGCSVPRRGFAAQAALGREAERRNGRGKGIAAPRFLLVRCFKG